MKLAGIRALALVPDSFGGHGGIALYMRDFLTALSLDKNFNHVVLLSRNESEQSEKIPKKIRFLQQASKGKLHFIAALLKLFLKQRDFDLIVCGHINLLPIAHLASLFTKAPILLMIYGIDAWTPTGGRMTKWILKGKVQVVSISEHTRRLFSRWSGISEKNIQILPNAIHLDKYGIEAKNDDLINRYDISGKRVLMTLGRLNASEQYKGIDEILEVLPKLLEATPDLVYMIVGDGDDLGRLQAKVSKNHLTQHVIFTGRVLESEKADYFRLADVFAMPGRGEGFGFVFLEAMASGIPVVASKLDGSLEAVKHGELGIVVDPDDPAELADGIKGALNMPNQIPEGLEYFSFDNFVARLGDINQQILEGQDE